MQVQKMGNEEGQSSEIEVKWHLVERRYHQTHIPKARFKHQSFFYKHSIYVYGGASMPGNQILEEPTDIHTINIEKTHHLKWEKHKIACHHKDLEAVSGHCGVVHSNKWFMFGGINSQFKSNSHLWRLNLDNLEMTKLQGSGAVPSPRESASLFSIDEHLVLYGGINTNSIQIYNSFHFFNIASKSWTKVEGTYLFQIYPRYDPSLCHFNNKIYLFGGVYRNTDNDEIYLNDFYEIEVNVPTPQSKSTVQVKRLQSSPSPQSRSGSNLVSTGDSIILLGGEHSCTNVNDGIRKDAVSLVQDSWIYNSLTSSWNQVKMNSKSPFKFTTQGSCLSGQDNKVYVFGGVQSYTNLINDLVELAIPSSSVQQKQLGSRIAACSSCSMKKQVALQSHISASLLEDIADSIEFPFAAFGLLMDNCIFHSASFVKIEYHEYIVDYRQRVIKIADNAKLAWTEEEFIETMGSYATESIQPPAGTDKKLKMAMVRDQLKRQYGTNIKMASLRLGSGFLHVSFSENGELIRVCLFAKQSKPRQTYILKYYIYSGQTQKVINPEMEAVRKEITLHYEALIKEALSKEDAKNTLFIFDPKVQDFRQKYQTEELKISQKNNDIIFCKPATYTKLEELGYNIFDCVDVSLRAYLVSLYLKNEHTTISLAVRKFQPTPISTQLYLERVDKLCRNKHVFQINSTVEFDFKIVELYYLYDTKRILNFFSNGLLIYHKNRLITRYKYNLGELIPKKMHQAQDNHNFIRLFGFIELPDHIPINAFKTKITFPIMMEKLYSRLKFINKKFKAEFQRLAVQGLKRSAPSKLTEDQIKQDLAENPEFALASSKPREAESKEEKEEKEEKEVNQQLEREKLQQKQKQKEKQKERVKEKQQKEPEIMKTELEEKKKTEKAENEKNPQQMEVKQNEKMENEQVENEQMNKESNDKEQKEEREQKEQKQEKQEREEQEKQEKEQKQKQEKEQEKQEREEREQKEQKQEREEKEQKEQKEQKQEREEKQEKEVKEKQQMQKQQMGQEQMKNEDVENKEMENEQMMEHEQKEQPQIQQSIKSPQMQAEGHDLEHHIQ